MGTTPKLAIPYPEDSDLVTNGAAAMQAIAEAVDDALGDFSARVFPTANVALSSGVLTTISHDGESFSTSGMHSTITNSSRVTIPAGGDGLYLVMAKVSFATASGYISTRVYKNGGQASATGTQGPGGDVALPISDLITLVAGDYLELVAYQAAGATNIYGSANGSETFLAVKRLA